MEGDNGPPFGVNYFEGLSFFHVSDIKGKSGQEGRFNLTSFKPCFIKTKYLSD